MKLNVNLKYWSSAGAVMLAGSYLGHEARQDQRRECTGADPPPTFCWPPNHLTPVQGERHLQSLRGVGLSSLSCPNQGHDGGRYLFKYEQ